MGRGGGLTRGLALPWEEEEEAAAEEEEEEAWEAGGGGALLLPKIALSMDPPGQYSVWMYRCLSSDHADRYRT